MGGHPGARASAGHQAVHHSVHLRMRSTQRRDLLSYVSPRLMPNDVFQATRPTLRPWITRPQAGDACLRGGALEPGACALAIKGIGKPRLTLSVSFFRAFKAHGTFLPRAGPQFALGLLKLSIILSRTANRSQNDEGDPVGSPSLRVAMRLVD